MTSREVPRFGRCSSHHGRWEEGDGLEREVWGREEGWE